MLIGLGAGCSSWSHTDRGALAGGLLGAGTGAIIGSSTGHAGAGTLLGAGLGTLTGALLGSELDNLEAKNRAMIAQQLGRPVRPGAVSMDDVLAMTQAGVAEELIVNHIRANGMQRPLTANDIILLQQQGVSTRVIAAMQEASQARQPSEPVQVISPPYPGPVIIEEYHYGPWGPPHWWWHYHYRPVRSRFSWGIAIGH
ncbi:MAG: glycine zipper domain-containing protein [Thermoguttaceae bacterium]|nr:glycine zipper domain-containing protein [Thermoguttaceae bacterium]MDW8036441.1 glycine zipper domain-containing protein [Thermoguttaceae bacterium]